MNATVEHIGLPWDRQMIESAAQEWGCNCGPAALAAVLRLSERETRTAFSKVGFMEKHYTNQTMMKQAIQEAGGQITRQNAGNRFPATGLARIQVDWAVDEAWRAGEGRLPQDALGGVVGVPATNDDLRREWRNLDAGSLGVHRRSLDHPRVRPEG